jgi:exosortase
MASVIALAVLVCAIGAAFWSSLLVVHDVWGDKYGAYSHGYLVLAISAWFCIRAWRASAKPFIGRPMWSALPMLAGIAGMALLAEVLYIGQIRTAFLPLLLLASIGLCLGRNALSRLAWPVLFLYMALPVWGVINGPLQALTTAVSQALVTSIGVPVFVEGNFVHLPSGTFEIASGCSGLSFFVAALTLAGVYCTLFLHTRGSRALLMLAAGAAGLVANWLRVASLIVIGHVTHMQHYLIRVDHLYYGWALFMLTMIPLFLLARRLEDRDLARGTLQGVGQPVPQWIQRWCARVLWIAVALAYASVLVLGLRERSTNDGRLARDAYVFRQTGQLATFASGWQPGFSGAAEFRQECQAEDVVEVFAAHYPRQSRDAHLSLPVNSATGPAFRVTSTGVTDGHVEIHGELAGRDHLLWTWYLAAGRTAYSKPTLRIAELLGLLSGRRDGWVIALQTQCQGNCDRARERLLQCSKAVLH